MSRFLEDARSIFEAARTVSAAGQTVTEFTLLVGAEGGLQLVAASDWPLERLRAERGARAAYRVEERGGRIRVEGSTGTLNCRLESDSPRQVARRLLNPTPSPLPAETGRLLPAASG